MPDKAIADTSALIALVKLRLSHLLCALYSEIILPQAVVDEYGTPDFPCVSIRQVGSRLINLLERDLNLGRGESEVIALSVETGIRVIIEAATGRVLCKREAARRTLQMEAVSPAKISYLNPAPQGGALPKAGGYSPAIPQHPLSVVLPAFYAVITQVGDHCPTFLLASAKDIRKN